MSDAVIRVRADTRDAERGLSSLQKGLQALAIGLVTNQVIQYSAAWTDLNSRLVNATGSQEAARKALQSISDTADRTYAPLQQTADVFLQNSLALTDLGYSTDEQIRLSGLLNNTLAVSGSRGQDAATAIAAFSRAVGEGRVTTETLNTLLQKNPRFVKAMSESLGVTVTELRRMAAAGELETGPMLDRLTGQMGKVSSEADAMQATIPDAMIRIDNAFLKLVGSMDEATGASAKIADAMIALSENLDAAAVAAGVFMAVLSVGKLGAIAKAFVALNAVMRRNPMVMIAAGIAVAAGALTAFVGKQEEVVEQQEEQQDNNQILLRQEKRKADLLARQVSETKKYFAEAQGQARIAGLFGEELEIRQAILAVANQLKIPEDQLSRSVRDRAVSIKQMEMNNRSLGQTQQTLLAIDQEISLLKIRDTKEQQIQRGLLDYRGTVTAKIFEQEKGRVELKLRERQLLQDITGLEQGLLSLQQQRTSPLKTDLQDLNKLIKAQSDGLVIFEQRIKIQNQIRDLTRSAATEEQDAIQDLANANMVLFNTYQAIQQSQLSQNVKEQAYARINQKNMEDAAKLSYQLHDIRMAQEDQLQAQIQKTFEIYYRQQGRSTDQARKMARERADFEKKTDQEKAQFAIEQGASVFTTLGKYNRQAFEASKALNIAQAVMNTYTGVTKALATYPPPFNFIAAAATLAFGLGQVATIRSQQYSGRAVGGPVSGGTPYIVGEAGPELFMPQGSGRIVPNTQLGSEPVNITFNINTVDARGMDQLLMERKGMIVGMVRNAINDRGVKAPM